MFKRATTLLRAISVFSLSVQVLMFGLLLGVTFPLAFLPQSFVCIKHFFFPAAVRLFFFFCTTILLLPIFLASFLFCFFVFFCLFCSPLSRLAVAFVALG